MAGCHSGLRQPHQGSRLECRFSGPTSGVLGSLSPAGEPGNLQYQGTSQVILMFSRDRGCDLSLGC